MVARKRLTAADWVDAALDALADGGVAAIAVEPIAARLGATKGSFYWHFAGRDALLAAALQHWEQAHTAEVIALVEAEPDATARLRALLAVAIGGLTADGGSGRVELALQPTAGHPLVAPVLARVTDRRLAYLAGLFTELGFAPEEARRRGLLAYAAYLGHAQLVHATPEHAPSGAALTGYMEAVVAVLTTR